MRNQIHLFAIITMLFIVSACNSGIKKQEHSHYTINGTLDSIPTGKIVLNVYTQEGGVIHDTTRIIDGKFFFEGHCPNPSRAYFNVVGMRYTRPFFLDESPITIKCNTKNIGNAGIEGGHVQQSAEKYYATFNTIINKINKIERSTNDRKVLSKLFKRRIKVTDSLKKKFVKDYPGDFYAAEIVRGKVSSMTSKNAIKTVKSYPDAFLKNPYTVKLLADLEERGRLENGFKSMVGGAKDVAYKVDPTYKGKHLKDMIYLTVSKDDQIIGLRKDSKVVISNANGEQISSFDVELSGKPLVLTVDDEGIIYVAGKNVRKESKKVRGRVVDRTVSVGFECGVYKNGKKVNTFRATNIPSISGIKYHDGMILATDASKGMLGKYNAKTGKSLGIIKNLRPCCGILDFSINKKNQLIVADLGSFRIQGYSMDGEKLICFGQRGKTLDDFHGCCNPVNVTCLSNGAIVTVEKDPTRIKVYSSEGAKKVEGVEELVKGCNYIPMTKDSKDNIYLASDKNGIVKCVSSVKR